MPCAAPSRNNLRVQGPCGFPIVPVVAGVDVSGQNLCLPHYALKWGLAAIPKGVAGGIDANTVFCFHADSLADTQGHPLTAFGDAKIDSAQSKFGGSALLLDGTGDYLSSPDSPDWAFGSGDFTLECWLNLANVATLNQAILAQFSSGPGQYSWMLRYNGASGIGFYVSGDGTALTTVANAWVPVAGTWYHVAAVRSGTSLLVFVNGVLLATTGTFSGPLFDSNQPLTIGGNAAGGWSLNGSLDEVRISKGIARWTSNFSVPTAPYT
jgi:hypothetical protein